MKSYCRGFTPALRARAGFTLSELLLAAAILVFVLAGLLVLFLNCVILNEANRNLTIATAHAQYIMEQIKDTADTGFANLENNINTGSWDLDASEIESAPYNFTALDNEGIDTSVTQSGNPLGISVAVQWIERGQRSRSTELVTLIANYQ